MKTDNELIAEFMGYEKVTVGYFGSSSETEWQARNQHWMEDVELNSIGDYIVKVKDNEWIDWKDVTYDRSWDWLMPVVIKCHEIGDAKEREYSEEKDLDDPTGWRSWSYRRVRLSTNIKQVYENVMEFIKWYNQNK